MVAADCAHDVRQRVSVGEDVLSAGVVHFLLPRLMSRKGEARAGNASTRALLAGGRIYGLASKIQRDD